MRQKPISERKCKVSKYSPKPPFCLSNPQASFFQSSGFFFSYLFSTFQHQSLCSAKKQSSVLSSLMGINSSEELQTDSVHVLCRDGKGALLDRIPVCIQQVKSKRKSGGFNMNIVTNRFCNHSFPQIGLCV